MMSESNEEKATKLLALAEKKLNSSKTFFWSLFSSPSTKQENAIECYQRAANLFKQDKNWRKAGDSFSKAANLYFQMGSRLDAAINYVDAANCYRKVNIEEAVNCLLRAIEKYTDLGRFTMAAKHHSTIAEMYEADNLNMERAVQHYEQAADYYFGEQQNASANKCLLKIAHYAAQLENYSKAIDIYQRVAVSSLTNSLLKYNAKEYLFNAALCNLCVDVMNAKHALEDYLQICPAFEDTREYKLIQTVIKHAEGNDVDGFTKTVQEYDSISRLSSWYAMLLMRVKREISGQPDLR